MPATNAWLSPHDEFGVAYRERMERAVVEEDLAVGLRLRFESQPVERAGEVVALFG